MNTKFIYITKAERRGTLVFFISIFIIITAQLINTKTRNAHAHKTNDEIVEILNKHDIQKKIAEENQLKKSPSTPFNSIDPNIASSKELENIGMSSYAIKSLLSYRSFKTIKNERDLAQVYGVDSTMLKSIRPYIQYPKIELAKKQSKRVKSIVELPKHPIDPNTASLEELISIGFSKFSSNNIVKLREKGGSFQDIEDIKKIYGVDEKTLQKVTEFLVFSSPNEKATSTIDSALTKKSSTFSTSQEKFDPNTATYEELVSQGIPSKISHTIVNFRNGKKVFEKAEDLLKVYGMTQVLLDSLSNRIVIQKENSSIKNDSISLPVVYDLSTVTAEELLEIDGIGKYFSKAIIKYRNSLGGYYSVSQLSEVPAMKPEIYEKIKDQFEIKGGIKRFVPIAMEFKEVLKHPYMDYETTQLMYNLSAVNYEKELDRLIKKGMVDSRLIPYLIAE